MMTDLQKLRYDLAMNCALVETQAEYQKNPELELHKEMWENFVYFAKLYSSFGKPAEMKQFMEMLNSEQFSIGDAKSIFKGKP